MEASARVCQCLGFRSNHFVLNISLDSGGCKGVEGSSLLHIDSCSADNLYFRIAILCVVLDGASQNANSTSRWDSISCAFSLHSTYYPETWQVVYNGFKATCTLLMSFFSGFSVPW